MKKFKIKWKNLFIMFIIICCSLGLLFSIINIVKWKTDSIKTNNQISKIEENTNVEEIKDNENTQIVNSNENIPSSNPYWDYIKMNLINVDFNELKSINKSVKGWIQVNGTNINYPFVQGSDNDYYLSHSFDKSYNDAGWVFLDYRNSIDTLDQNTIIYAHGRIDNTMFGSLKNSLTSGWLNNTNNYIIKLSTEKENSLWQVFSVYRIPTTSDYLQISFNTNKSFLKFTQILLNRSVHSFNTSINENDKILTLSTCYNDNDKVVLHAKLIKSQKK